MVLSPAWRGLFSVDGLPPGTEVTLPLRGDCLRGLHFFRGLGMLSPPPDQLFHLSPTLTVLRPDEQSFPYFLRTRCSPFNDVPVLHEASVFLQVNPPPSAGSSISPPRPRRPGSSLRSSIIPTV